MKPLSPFVRYDLPVIIKMLLPTLFIAAVSVHFHEFVVSAIMANKAINSGIILTALAGVVLILLRLISTQHDMSALNRFSREAQATGDMKQLIEMPWIKGRPIRHYLEHLAYTEGTLDSQLDQDAIQNELSALNEEYNSKMELPQFLVGFMIAMGLLGTFIGLLETLTGISGMLDGMGHGGDIEKEFSKLVVELRKPLSGMGIAFSASMFGLITSLQLSIMMIMLRRYTSRVMEKARSVMHKLLTRTKIAPAPDNSGLIAALAAAPQDSGTRSSTSGGHGGYYSGGHADTSFMATQPNRYEEDASANTAITSDNSALGEKISDAYFRSQDAIASMANSVSLLVKRLDAVTRSLEENLEATQHTNDLLSFGPRMTEANEKMVDEVKMLTAVQVEGHKLMQKVISSLIQIDQSLMANSTKDVVTVQREATSALSELFGNSQTQTRLFSEFLETQREGTRDTLLSLRSIHERLAKQDDIYVGTTRNLSDIKDQFAKAVNSFALIDTVAENIGRQTLMLEASITEDRNSQKAIVSSIQRELRDFTDSIRQTLGVKGS